MIISSLSLDFTLYYQRACDLAWDEICFSLCHLARGLVRRNIALSVTHDVRETVRNQRSGEEQTEVEQTMRKTIMDKRGWIKSKEFIVRKG